MKSTSLLILIALLVVSSSVYADLLLDDTWADASRGETNLPTESAFWVGHPGQVTMGTGSLAYSMGTSSEKMFTYFAADGAPASIGVGQQLVTTIKFTPTGLYSTASENFRFGVFNDPTDSQIHSDTNDDGGGTGDLGQPDPWTDSTGYAVQMALSDGVTASDNPYIGKRTDMLNASLLGSSGAYAWVNDGAGANIVATSGALTTLEFIMDRVGVDQMQLTFTISDTVNGVLSTLQMTDASGIYTNFDHLFFRPSKAEGSADVLDFHELKVELIPEPATMVLLGLGGLIAARRKR
jgi:hypothetical protein